jgi:ABC-type multidrug transport system fused ATPase/permease subunit
MRKDAYRLSSLLRDLYRFGKPYRGRFIFGSILRLIADIVWLYPPYAFSLLITMVSNWTPDTSVQSIYIIFVLISVSVIVRAGGQNIGRAIGLYAVEKTAIDARLAATEHLLHLDIDWHEKENTGNRVKRIDRAVEGIIKLGRVWFNNLIEIPVVLVGVALIIFSIDRMIVVYSAIFVVVFYIISRLSLKSAVAASHDVNVQEEQLTGALFEGMHNIRTIKVLNMIGGVMKKLHATSSVLMTKVAARISRFQTRNALLTLWTNGFRVLMMFVIVQGVIAGEYGAGFLALFFVYFSRIQESVTELSDVVETYATSKQAVHRMMEVLYVPISKDGFGAERDFPNDWQKISLRKVSFSYGGDKVLDNISCDIRRGERVGIVGASGAGKSTLFKILLKESEKFSGQVLVDDIPLQKIKKSSYYHHVAIVLQETEVFNASLKENIAIVGRGSGSDMRAALDIAHVTPFLSRLPKGINSIIGEKGIRLSGGERQRIGIARAIFKKPDILFLDEATSHLDVESEEKIQTALHTFFKDVTALVIAHRLTTIKEMDRILVMDKGRIVESGTFEELQAKKGKFYDLWKKQKLNAEQTHS